MSKYSAALLHILLIVLATLTTTLDKGLNLAAAVQLGILVVSAFGVYFLPLLKVKFAGVLKVADAALAAALTALAPLVLSGHITPSEWITVALAGLSVVGVALGIDARVTASPLRSTLTVTSADHTATFTTAAPVAVVPPTVPPTA